MPKNIKQLFCAMLLLCISSYGLAQVSVGIDHLFEPQYLKWIKGKNIALITNLASRNKRGKSSYDLLRNSNEFTLKAIFTPEHGLAAKLDQHISDKQTSKSLIPIYSLYGPRSTPSKQQLKGIDVIVYDLQDVGLRYYTFNATLGRLVKQAADCNIPLVVLDRPDPLGEQVVSGDHTAKQRLGHFTSYFNLPSRYGMTPAELALTYNAQQHLGATIHVVPLQGWHRTMLWPQTGLKWYPPSPALTTFKQVYLYAMLGPLESLRLAVGRSLDNRNAFQRIGAPYITAKQANKLAQQLNQLNYANLYFTPVQWRVTRGLFKGKLVHGVSIHLNKFKHINPSKVQYQLVKALYKAFGDRLKLAGIDGMEGSPSFRQSIEHDLSYQHWLQHYRQDNLAIVNHMHHLYD